jgi:hypothetical protein
MFSAADGGKKSNMGWLLLCNTVAAATLSYSQQSLRIKEHSPCA